eukprot:CAMPEP_0204244122 /NCGR_PEP_ID=MMETSP0361-20130328/96825_1 /ASSEMBLY_ACC=CAM_ASM_000343 /TAXON_ID=268821 /ORGANISM="Scrippsiella Hangoei, Strain SHTV-5" /LENGTH=41 /DNA_ID= /DNA_START= /DNA_END= /DNA_ORIENTATION=
MPLIPLQLKLLPGLFGNQAHLRQPRHIQRRAVDGAPPLHWH